MTAYALLIALALGLPTTAPIDTPTPTDALLLQARRITVSATEIASISTKLQVGTLLVFPAQDDIVEVRCPDKEFWIVDVSGTVLSVKPAKAGGSTALHVLTARGTVYSFLVTEVSDRRGIPADVKVFVDPEETHDSAVTFVRRTEVETVKQQLESTERELREVKAREQSALADALAAQRRTYPASLRFPYRLTGNGDAFHIQAMWHDDRFTYVRATPRELPALYELQDDKPALVTVEYRDGLYIVTKILDRGYFALGKAQLAFTRQEDR